VSKLTMHALAVHTFVGMLGALTHLFEKAEEAAATKRLNLANLASARLAPDMYPFSLQVELACYHAKTAIAQLTGAEPPPLPTLKNDATFDDLNLRVSETLGELQSVPDAKLAGTEERVVEVPLMGELYFEATGFEYLRDWALPHFYFHIVTAYDVLRNAGVDIGKRDFMFGVGRYIHTRGREKGTT
jgi:uncharacterized protein